jgi:hypothetical protein
MGFLNFIWHQASTSIQQQTIPTTTNLKQAKHDECEVKKNIIIIVSILLQSKETMMMMMKKREKKTT